MQRRGSRFLGLSVWVPNVSRIEDGPPGVLLKVYGVLPGYTETVRPNSEFSQHCATGRAPKLRQALQQAMLRRLSVGRGPAGVGRSLLGLACLKRLPRWLEQPASEAPRPRGPAILTGLDLKTLAVARRGPKKQQV